MSAVLQQLVSQPYKHGFVTDIESETAPRGLSEDVIRMISAKKGEPDDCCLLRGDADAFFLNIAPLQECMPKACQSRGGIDIVSVSSFIHIGCMRTRVH
jgi:hypothetical protein